MDLRNARSEQVANGVWHRTEQEWAHIEKPIKLLDHEIARFADKHGINISKNKKDWPERSLRWGNDIQCLIQVYLADQDTLTLNLWICASQDRGKQRYWKREFLIHEAQVSDVENSLFGVLELGKQRLDLWSAHPEELEFATELNV